MRTLLWTTVLVWALRGTGTALPDVLDRGKVLNEDFGTGLSALAYKTSEGPAGSHIQNQPMEILVGRNVQVSTSQPTSPHDEVMLAVDPANSERMAACSVVLFAHDGRRSTVAYASRDGGSTWRQVLSSDYWRESADPTCLFGPDGTLYVGVEGGDARLPEFADVYRSRDVGESWLPKYRIPIFHDYDRHFLAADNGSKSRYRGRLYLSAYKAALGVNGESRVGGYVLLHSADSGATWAQAASRMALAGSRAGNPGNCDVLADGTVVCVLELLRDLSPEDESSGDIRAVGSVNVVKSSDGGETLTMATRIDEIFEARVGFKAPIVPRIAVDHSNGPFKDRLYVVWPDRRSGRDEIWLSSSADSGRTWSQAIPVNDDQPRLARRGGSGFYHYLPQVAVNKDGIVGVMWYDRRDRAGSLGYWVRFAASLDGGERFLQSVRVSERPQVVGQGEAWPLVATDGFGLGLRPSAFKHLQVLAYVKHMTGGETSGLAVDMLGRFHALWTDNRTGVDQVWTAPITVRGPTEKYGDSELGPLRDVSAKIRLEVLRTSYTAEKNVLIQLALRNLSSDTLGGPLIARVVRLGSGTGVAQALNSENGAGGVGALWRFEPSSEGGALLPDHLSQSKTLIFRVSDLGSLNRLDLANFRWEDLNVVDLDFQLLAGGARVGSN